jgi:predicted nucleic acid-binding protein
VKDILVVDASVAAKWVLPEAHSEEALHLGRAGKRLIAPDILHPELGNSLWKRIRRSELSVEEARRNLAWLVRAPVRIHPSSALLPGALDLAVLLSRSVYDCLYVALAVRADTRVVTADRPFYESVKASLLSDRIVWIQDS